MADYVLTVHGRHYPIHPRGLRLGRGPGNDIVLSDDGVSREHARVWLRGDEVVVQDLDSTNGTFVNDIKISEPCSLRPGDSFQVGRAVIEVGTARTASGGLGRLSLPTPLLIAAPVVLVAVVAVAVLGITLASNLTEPDPVPTTPPITPPSDGLDAELLERARLATVLILALDYSGNPFAGGSGGVIDPRGYILTNYHVVEGSSGLLIGINAVDENKPAEFAYLAEPVSMDPDLDLALLRIVSDEDGQPLPAEISLPTLPIGDSDAVRIGDDVIILGFPDIGGETLTLTSGSVSGFTEDILGHIRGWIKTDAEISPGNSGGVAVNEEGELIGIPTYVSSEERTLGRLGGLRPIVLARPLLDQIH
jgi:S1-C subfamily serine protease